MKKEQKVIYKQIQPSSGTEMRSSAYTWYLSPLWIYVMQALNEVAQEVILLTANWKVTILNLHSDIKQYDWEFCNFP